MDKTNGKNYCSFVLLFKAEQIYNKDASIPSYVVIFFVSATLICYIQFWLFLITFTCQ